MYDQEIKSIITDLARDHNFQVEKMESDQDHIHLLISAMPKISPSQIVKSIKQATTYQLWQNHEADLKKEFRKDHTFWSPSYFVYSIGSVSKEAIERYIESQRNSSTSLKRK